MPITIVFIRFLVQTKTAKGVNSCLRLKAKVPCVQYHPEKIPFEWVVEKEPIPHSFDAVVASQYFANFFVSEARKSEKKLSNENDYLIYNYNASFTGKTGGYFTESYFFTV